MDTSWERAIAQVRGEEGGTGVVVDRDKRLLLTCAHVVGSRKQVQVRFPGHDAILPAKVLENWNSPRGDLPALDAVLMEVIEDLPEGVNPALLGLEVVPDRRFHSRGFRKADQFPAGLDARGHIGGPTQDPKGRPSIQLWSKDIDEGMSGAPLVDEESGLVVGLISARWETPRHVDSELNFGVSLKEIAGRWPELRELARWPAQVEAYLEAVRKYVRDLPYVSLAEEALPPLERVYVRLQAQEQPGPRRESGAAERKKEAPEGHSPVPVPAIDALRDHERLVIVGPPGTGKSTFVRHLTLQIAAREVAGLRTPHLPLLVSLRGLAERKGDLATRLRAQVQAELGLRLSNPLGEDSLEAWPQETGVEWLICLDGLDEVVDKGRCRDLVGQLQNAAWPGSRIVITSRPDAAATEALDHTVFPRFDLLPFGDAEQETFAQRWFGPEEAGLFLEVLVTALPEELRGLPLLLTVAAIVYQKGGMQPEAGRIRRSALYEQFITILLQEDEVPGRHMKEQFERLLPRDLGSRIFELRREVLEEMALALQKGQKAEPAMAGFLQMHHLAHSDLEARKQAERMIDVLAAQRTGLVIRRGETVEFTHSTFREFLAASALARAYGNAPDLNGLWAELEPYLLDSTWAEVVVLTVALLRPGRATSLVRRLATDTRDKGWQRPLFLAASVLAEGTKVSDAVHKRVVDGLLHLARTRHRNGLLRPDWKLQPSFEFGRRYGANAQDALRALSKLKGDDYASRGLLTLAREGQAISKYPPGLPNLPDRLAEDMASLGVEIAEALIQMGQTELAGTILFGLLRDRDKESFWVRHHVTTPYTIRLLGDLEEDKDEATAFLLDIADDQEVSAYGRVEAARGLAKLGWKDKAKAVLLGMACDEETVSAEAIAALEWDTEEIDRLLEIAQSETMPPAARVEVAEAAGQLGAVEQAANILLALACDEVVWDSWSNQAPGLLGPSSQAQAALPSWKLMSRAPGLRRRTPILPGDSKRKRRWRKVDQGGGIRHVR
jgi:energy-coupling factor transporter ATP-binding protein EcfA2